MDWRSKIVFGPAGNGRPMLKNGLVPVEWILERLSEGWSASRISEEKPEVSAEDILAALAFATDTVRRASPRGEGIRASLDELYAKVPADLDPAVAAAQLASLSNDEW